MIKRERLHKARTPRNNNGTILINKKNKDLGLDDGTPKYITQPKLPTAQNNKDIEQQQIARCELVMLKGVREPYQIAEVLSDKKKGVTISTLKAKALMQKVHTRWEITSKGLDIKRIKGEYIRKLQKVENALWGEIMNSKNDARSRIAASRVYMEVIEKKLPLQGVTADKLLNDSQMTPSSLDGNYNKSQVMGEIAGRFLSLIDSQKNNEDMRVINELKSD